MGVSSLSATGFQKKNILIKKNGGTMHENKV
jgi:hypothetical protein